MPHIFVDADACPVKEEVYRVAKRYDLGVTLVAGSWMRIPEEDNLSLKVVGEGMDAADDWIVEHVEADALGPAGKPFTPENIGSALATRDLLSALRDCGEVTGGPPPFAKRDRSRFFHQLDEAINAIRRKGP